MFKWLPENKTFYPWECLFRQRSKTGTEVTLYFILMKAIKSAILQGMAREMFNK